MMTKNTLSQQEKMELVMLEQLVKKDHLLRKIDAHIDFTFIYDVVEVLYSQDNGRPSVDPIVLFKMELIQKLYGIRSIRRLVDDIHHNMAYRWFLGYGITDSIPDHSVFSQNKIRRYQSSSKYLEIFEIIVKQAIEKGLVKGKIVYTDSTHIRANASNSKYESEEIEFVISKNKDIDRINSVRERHGQKPLKVLEDKIGTKRKKVSKTDPDCAFMNRDRKPRGFYFLDHITVDSSYNIILDAFVTPGNVHDSISYLERLDYVMATYELPKTLKYTSADAGYFNNNVLLGLKERNLHPIIGATKFAKKPGKDSKYWFSYDLIEDVYICREGQLLEYKTTNRQGYSEYESEKETCEKCQRKDQCLLSNNVTRIIRRHVNEEYKDEAREVLKTDKGKNIYSRRKETVERVFADAKEIHGFRYAHFRGIEKVQTEAYLVAIAQNIKKMAMVLDAKATSE